MTKDEALKLALETLECWQRNQDCNEPMSKILEAIKEALAQPEQEPVAFENWHKANYVQNLERYGDTYKNNHVRCRHQGWLGAQSFLSQRTWVGLTDDDKVLIKHDANFNQFMTAGEYADRVQQLTEARLKDKNT